jgi:flagellar protein FlaG
MEVNGISTSASAREIPATAPAEVVRTDQGAQNREVIRAVKALNGAEMFGDENELTFQLDAATRRMVVRLVNRKTSEVVSQIPQEYVLRLAEGLPKSGA